MIDLMWVEPDDNNAPIGGYQVMYMEPEFVEGERMRTVNTSVVMATITGLSPGVDYTFTVIAYNDIGPSTPSDPLTVRTLDERRTLHHHIIIVMSSYFYPIQYLIVHH